MPAEIYTIHHKTPEMRKIEKIAESIKEGAVILYPTDTGFALGCELSNKEAIEKLRLIRRMPEGKSLTFMCESLSNIADFAKVSNQAYKAIKRLIPGPYTFILTASKLVPKFAQDPKRKTAGIKVPQNDLSRLLLKAVGSPIISISAKIDGEEQLKTPEEIINKFSPMVDIAMTSDEYNFIGESTLIDMTTDDFKILRKGAGFEGLNDLIDFEE